MKNNNKFILNELRYNRCSILLDDVENLVVPNDLSTALNKHDGAMDFFQSQSKSIKKQMLYWIIIPKRAETRRKRIAELEQAASQGKRLDRFR